MELTLIIFASIFICATLLGMIAFGITVLNDREIPRFASAIIGAVVISGALTIGMTIAIQISAKEPLRDGRVVDFDYRPAGYHRAGKYNSWHDEQYYIIIYSHNQIRVIPVSKEVHDSHPFGSFYSEK